MGEGDTPLVRSRRLEKEVGCGELYFKLEGCNPTGSFKDRGMVVAVAKALEEGSKAVICASTGNTSASAAAYAAHCGLEAYVVVPQGKIALGKLAQAIAHGAEIIAIDGNFDQALSLARAITEKHPIALVNSLNPYRIEGQKTAAFEIVDALGDAPDYLFIPVGNAGNITAYWKGFVEYHRLRRGQQAAAHDGLPGGGRGAHRPGAAGGRARDHRHGHPHRQPGQLEGGRGRPRRVRRRHRGRQRRRDPGRLPPAGPARRASSASRPRPPRWPGLLKMAPAGAGPARASRRLRHHRQRPQGPRHGHDHPRRDAGGGGGPGRRWKRRWGWREARAL